MRELEHDHALIGWYDQIVFTKKSWCLAVWGGLSAFGLYHSNRTILLLGLVTVVGFALSELVLRRYQRRYVVRAEELEQKLATGDLSDYRLSLAETPGRSERFREILYALRQPHYTLFYSMLIAISAWLVVW